MLIEAAISEMLLNTTDAAARVYSEGEPDEAASNQCAYPLIVYDETVSENVATLRGNTGIVKAEYSIDCRGLNAVGARRTMKQCQKIMDNFAGTVGGIRVKRINAKKTQSTWHPETTKHLKYFSCELTAEIWFFDPDVQ